MDVRNTMSYDAVIQAANANKFKGYNNFPLKALQFHSFMWAAQDAGTCLRKGKTLLVGRSECVLYNNTGPLTSLILLIVAFNRMVHTCRRGVSMGNTLHQHYLDR